MSIWSDLLGTTKTYFKIGLAGVRLKNSTGNLIVRNTGDSADAEITTSKINVSGELLDINSDAAGSGADWKYTLQRPAAGMTAAVTLTLPPDDGSSGQVLTTDGSGVMTWSTTGSSASSEKIDSTSFTFASATPVAMFTTGASDVIDHIDVIIDTTFNDTAETISIGISGNVSKYMATTESNLNDTAQTVFTAHPGLGAQGAEALIITLAGGATVGAARVLVHYATPS